jgi:hypothetical protein
MRTLDCSKWADGKIAAVDASAKTITIMTADECLTLHLDRGAELTVDDEPRALATLRPGSDARILYWAGSKVASAVQVYVRTHHPKLAAERTKQAALAAQSAAPDRCILIDGVLKHVDNPDHRTTITLVRQNGKETHYNLAQDVEYRKDGNLCGASDIAAGQDARIAYNADQRTVFSVAVFVAFPIPPLKGN